MMIYRMVSRFTVLALLLAAVPASAVLHFEGFEDPAYTPGGNNWNDFGGATITRVPSGTAGITSSSGVGHAVLTSGNGPFTRYGGYSSSFGSGFQTSLDVFIDPSSFASGTGFDFTSAVSNQSGGHLRDFIFHVGKVGSDLKVNASNNTDSVFNSFKIENENGGDNFTINSSGWYTFEHTFREDAGTLAVDLNLRDSSGSLLYSITRSNPADDIATTVGGNRYGWFTFNDIAGLAIDNTTLAAIPEPGAVLVWSTITAAFGCMAARRRGRNEHDA